MTSVNAETQLVVSSTHPELVERLLDLEGRKQNRLKASEAKCHHIQICADKLLQAKVWGAHCQLIVSVTFF